MDRKSIIVLVACFLVVLALPKLANKIYPPIPSQIRATNAPATTSTRGTNQTAVLQPGSAAPAAPIIAPQPVVNTQLAEETIEVTNATARYTFTSHGGGLKLVELLQFPETVSTRRERQSRGSRVAMLNNLAPSPTLAVLGGEAVQGDGVFLVTNIAGGVRAEKSLPNGLSIVKDFLIGSNYLITATVRFENRSAQALTLPAQEWVAGMATPMNAQDDGSTVGVMWYNGAKAKDILGSSFFSSRGFACTPRVPPAEFRGGESNVVWASVHNQFFAVAFMPQDPALQLVIRKVDLPRPSQEEVGLDSRIVKEPEGYEAALVYPGLVIAPGETVKRQVALYAGPKEYRTLAAIAATLNNNVDAVMDFGGFFGFFSKGLLLAMNWLHGALSLSYGWAIIAITLIIKALFWPLTQASTRSMKRMQALQPQIKALQAKYKDDPAKSQRKMMEFWKENKVNPMSGCLPMVIQMPVFIGFFYMIRSAIELRGASFLWVGDLSRPDTLFLIPGLNFPFNLLPLIMGGTMLWQAHLTPPSPGMDPAQAKMMRYMPLMFMVFLYNFSAGLTLYWTVQNLLTIAQTKLTRTTPPAPGSPQAPVLTPPLKKRK